MSPLVFHRPSGGPPPPDPRGVNRYQLFLARQRYDTTDILGHQTAICGCWYVFGSDCRIHLNMLLIEAADKIRRFIPGPAHIYREDWGALPSSFLHLVLPGFGIVIGGG